MVVFWIKIPFCLLFENNFSEKHNASTNNVKDRLNINLNLVCILLSSWNKRLLFERLYVNCTNICEFLSLHFLSFVLHSHLVSLRVMKLSHKTTETSVQLWSEDRFRNVGSVNLLIKNFLCFPKWLVLLLALCGVECINTCAWTRCEPVPPVSTTGFAQLANVNNASDGMCSKEQQQ